RHRRDDRGQDLQRRRGAAALALNCARLTTPLDTRLHLNSQNRTMIRSRLAFALLAGAAGLAASAPAPALAQERQEMVALEWREVMEPGSRLHLHNVNGGITVEAGSGDRAEVIVHKRWRRGDPDQVRVEARRINGDRDAIICAFWNENASCDE